MRIALVGYGKMGKTIERLAKERQHEIVLIIDQEHLTDFTTENIRKAEVVIEFTRPETAFQNIEKIWRAGVPVVSGTTGWHDRFEEALALCKKLDGTFFYASNFSIGVNIFFEINRQLAKLLDKHNAYKVSIEEIHHIHKLDAPSGTAVKIANDICENISSLQGWQLTDASHTHSIDTIPIHAKRMGDIFGTHIVRYQSPIDDIEISHIAKSREGFAMGAILAAEWVFDKKGIFDMQDLLNNIY